MADMIQARNFRLVGRSTREIARYTGLSEAEVEMTLMASASMVKFQCGLWGFANGEDASHEPLTIDHSKPAKAAKPVKALPKVTSKATPKEIPKAIKDDASVDSMMDEL